MTAPDSSPVTLKFSVPPAMAEQLRAAMRPALTGRNGTVFVAHFYDTLFKLAPGMRPHFPTHLADLQRKLLRTIGEFFSRLDDTPAVAGMLQGIRHLHPSLPQPDAVAEVFTQCFAKAYEEAALKPFPPTLWPVLKIVLKEAVMVLIDQPKASAEEPATATTT